MFASARPFSAPVSGPRVDHHLMGLALQMRLYPITILVSGPSRANSRSISDLVMETHPAVGPKFSRARCRKTALPRPAIRGEVL